MEIRILSAGKEIGPYSESQVRQYLSEGIISATDPALVEGTSEWQATGELLARLAPPEAAHEAQRPISVRTSAIPRVKRGPIVLQAAVGSETDTPRRNRPGKSVITIEPPRPTTQLPPVAKFVPRDESKTARGAVDTGPLAPAHFFERAAAEPVSQAPVTPPSEEDLLDLEEPPAAPLPDVPPQGEPLQDFGEEESQALPHAMWYASLLVGLIGLAFVVAIIYLVWHFSMPAPHAPAPAGSASSAAPAASPANPQTAADYSARGFSREQKGDIDAALADYDKALSLDARNTDALYHRAIARQTKGNWDGALADYNALLAITPNNAMAYSNRGYVKQRQGNVDSALADYTEALARDPTIAVAYYNVGLIKVRRGDIDGGIEAFNRALDLNPKLALAYYNRGNAKNTEGNLDGAIADYTQAIDVEPTNAMAYFNRGNARQAKGDANGALADYGQAIANDPNLAAAYHGRGELEALHGDYASALADTTQAINLDPHEQKAFFHRGLAELGLRNLASAAADLTRYCTLAPHSPECDAARLYLWVIGAEQGARDKADDQLAYALQNTWNSSPEDLTSMIANYLVGHLTEHDLVANASAPDPSLEPARFCRVWYFAGVKRQVTGDAATAASYFQKAVATGQKDCSEYLFARAQMASLDPSRQASSQTAGPVAP